MKQSAFLFVLILFASCSPLFAQKAKTITEIINQETEQIETYDTSGFGEYQVAIRFPYASARVLNKADYDSIQAFSKISVEYIYTKYTHSQPHQKELDRDRFEALQRIAPDLFTNPRINWDILVQTSATTAEDARGLFHGFVITYQPPVTEARKMRIKSNLDNIVDCAKKRPPEGSPEFPGGRDSMNLWLKQNIKFPVKELKTKGMTRTALVEFEIDVATGLPALVRTTKGVSPAHNDHIKTMVSKMPEWSEGISEVQFSMLLTFTYTEDGRQVIDVSPLRGYDPEKCRGIQSDSLVGSVMDRHKEWEKMLVVEDVTGSMMPYIADLLLWNALKGNLEKTQHFVFFNDGDKKDDDDKVIGSTGGLYHTKPQSVDKLEDKMIEAVVGGDGGDSPENDIEAILEGIKACPECKEVVLIADNSATPRDLELVEKIGRPVRVILCGVRSNINPAHLYIAWKTKGSVHTIKQDITSLTDLQEGQTLKVMGQTFKIVKGQLVETTRF